MARAYIPLNVRRRVIRRAQRCCEYCQSQMAYATQSFDIDHIIPLSLGGSSELDNLALACSGCNACKHQRVSAPDPVDGREASIFHPRRERWSDHFGWDESYSHVLGLTPTGRATVEALQLNRSGVVNLRQLMRLAGKHPPA